MCSANLRGIGQSMYIYAQDGDVFPSIAQIDLQSRCRAFFNLNGQAGDRILAAGVFGPPTTGVPSVTVDLWTLVRANNTTPKQFICPSTTNQPDPAQDTTAYYDFLGPNNLSYAYQYQHDPNRKAIGTSSEPIFPVMADTNPYIGPNLVTAQILPDRRGANRGNSVNHTNREGQNILFQDSHVLFEKGPDVGLAGRVNAAIKSSRGRDNCYTLHFFGLEVDPGLVKPTVTATANGGLVNLGSKSDAGLVP